jgi:hypothetical protein
MLTHTRMRDEVAARTGYTKDVVAHVLDELGVLIEEEFLQQGEVILRGLFRVIPTIRTYRRDTVVGNPLHGEDAVQRAEVRRIILTIRPVRSLRKKLSGVPLPG